MAKQTPELSSAHSDFISSQKLFFVATATADSKINVSPKGMDSLRIIDSKTVAWLNVTGSGNETAAHLQTHPRMTIMFCAFEGNPMILRLYGHATMTQKGEPGWEDQYQLFNPIAGARQVFTLHIDTVQTSCGMAVPFFDYSSEREQLSDWAGKQGDEGIRNYWDKKNRQSIDGIAIKLPD